MKTEDARRLGAEIVSAGGDVKALLERGPAVIAALLDRIAVMEADERGLRGVIEGRREPPTSEELAAHDRGVPMSGLWLCRMRGRFKVMRHDEVIGHHNGAMLGWWGVDEARWWALDSDRGICEPPVVPRETDR